MNTHLLSVRINERGNKKKKKKVEDEDESDEDEDMMMMMGDSNPSGDNKKLAYLLDAQTIRVLDLVQDNALATINHDSKIDFLELNDSGNIVMFRDKRRRLVMFHIEEQKKSTLLSYCNYAQWVPKSDVVVGQCRQVLHVWYVSCVSP
jgi:intraflagellar transport protein 172